MAGLQELRFPEEKPLLRGQDAAEMVSCPFQVLGLSATLWRNWKLYVLVFPVVIGRPSLRSQNHPELTCSFLEKRVRASLGAQPMSLGMVPAHLALQLGDAGVQSLPPLAPCLLSTHLQKQQQGLGWDGLARALGNPTTRDHSPAPEQNMVGPSFNV